MVWFGSVWFGLVWFGLVWFALVCVCVCQCQCIQHARARTSTALRGGEACSFRFGSFRFVSDSDSEIDSDSDIDSDIDRDCDSDSECDSDWTLVVGPTAIGRWRDVLRQSTHWPTATVRLLAPCAPLGPCV